uniref:Cytochrome b n=1 Tax=Tremex columba TaxID=222809 RepID=A0A3G5BC75_TRECO|nr:cytochrome b [Tremex columba]AYV97241.1 cytochrome b [Tremex columba]
MNKSILKYNQIFASLNSSFISLPTPLNISYWWNFGSILGLLMIIQILSGFILSIHYCPNISFAFTSVIYINQNIKNGWLLHFIHMNGASFLFLSIIPHIFRGIYYSSFKKKGTWLIGWILLLFLMLSAFLGYILPWGQMSYWGATVITNLLSTIPFIGKMMVEWIWGGFSINNSTLNRFFSFHFIFPLIMLIYISLHLIFLHSSGSNNPLGINSNMWKIPFHPFFSFKDIFGYTLILSFFFVFMLISPYKLGDPENFIPADPMKTPIHIQPEWYFLFSYAILRSIPNKIGGVILMFLSISSILILPLFKQMFNSLHFYPISQYLFWMFFFSLTYLSWLGSQQITNLYISLSQMFSLTYFMFYIILFLSNFIWDKMMY